MHRDFAGDNAARRTMSSETYHEPYDVLSTETVDLHRAVASVMEELEAIDWYQQRADACSDEELRAILVHNQKEEMEHAMMTLEWIRRRSQKFDEATRRFLHSEGPIVRQEEEAKDGATSDEVADRSLELGSLKDDEGQR